MLLAAVAALDEHGFIRLETHATRREAEDWIAYVVSSTKADLRFEYVQLTITDIPTQKILMDEWIGRHEEDIDGDFNESWGTNYDLNSET